MRSFFSILSIVLSLTFISSCKDKKDPVINFISPSTDSQYQVNQAFTIHAEMEDDRGIISHRYYIGDENGIPSTEFTDSGEANLKKKEKKQTLKITGSIPTVSPGDYYVHVEVTDASGKTTKASRRFYVN